MMMLFKKEKERLFVVSKKEYSLALSLSDSMAFSFMRASGVLLALCERESFFSKKKFPFFFFLFFLSVSRLGFYRVL